MLAADSLWARFFKAKYVNNGLVDVASLGRVGSRFWRSVVVCLPDVIANSQWKVKE